MVKLVTSLEMARPTTVLSKSDRNGDLSWIADPPFDENGVRTSFPKESGVRATFCVFSSCSYAVIFATSVSNNCSTRPSLSPSWFPLEASLSSGYSCDKQVVPRVRHPEQTGTSSELNWQRTFLLLPAPCQIVL